MSWPLMLSVLLASLARAQDPNSDVVYSRHPIFRIPFQTDPGERRIQQVQLHYSINQGQSWLPYANALPDQASFKFTAERDGLFWFAVRTVDQEGNMHPPTLDQLRPGLKVYVDTVPPSVTLQELPRHQGMVGVSWNVRDDNLDLLSLQLEYRLTGNGAWQTVPLPGASAVGQKYWNPATNAPLEARLRVRDRAENWGEAKTTISQGAYAGNGAAPLSESPAPQNPTVRMVNSKRISLNYAVEEIGPSGLSVVELWYTRDTRSWQKYEERQFEQKTTQPPPFVFEVSEEGLYGFTLLVRSGVGLGQRPPQVGEAPQIWVEVDTTKPVVQVMNVEVGRGSDLGNLTVTWQATDKNLGRQPITISYAEQAGGPWTVIAANLENTGRYIWRMPQGSVPYRFFMKVEAVDRAGNIGAAEHSQAVIVDLAQPKVRILDVGVQPQ
ncbi:MAG: hypothetical protein ACK4RK_20460 [Gemmataceae bacterium]